jgi:hypothetical protein
MDDHGVLSAVANRARALVDGDAAGLAAHLHPVFRWTSYRGERFDREAYVTANTSSALRWLGQRMEGPDVVVDGDTAVVTGVAVDDVVWADDVEQDRLLLTMTWIRRGDRWLCLAGHAGTSAP